MKAESHATHRNNKKDNADHAGQDSQRCLFCNGTDIYVKYSLTAHSILRCRRCDFMWLDPQPQTGQLDKIYSSSYFNNKKLITSNDYNIYGYHDYLDERFTRQGTYKPIIRKALSYIDKNMHGKTQFLDVGCGLGFLMDVAHDQGCQVAGVEFNPFAVEHIRQKYVFPVFQGDVLDFSSSQLFDIVAMIDVIEHLMCPIKAIKKVSQMLRPGGIFILSTMDSDSIVSRVLGKKLEDFRRVSEHLYFFTKKTIQAFLEREGFEVLDIKYYGHTFQLDFLADRLKNVSLLISRVMQFLINFLRIGKFMVYINPRTKIVVYARKRTM